MCTALQTSAVEVRTGHFSFQLFLVMKVSVSRQEALINILLTDDSSLDIN